jgi:hypothetical protein
VELIWPLKVQFYKLVHVHVVIVVVISLIIITKYEMLIYKAEQHTECPIGTLLYYLYSCLSYC